MSPQETFRIWDKHIGFILVCRLVNKYSVSYSEACDVVRKSFMDGYELANHPTERIEPCVKDLPLCAFGPDSACR